MMKKLFISSTLLFGIAVAGYWLAAALTPEPVGQTAVAAPTEKQYSLQDVAKHATPGDCWMSINGQVYDFTAYLPGHPADPAVIQPWCGKDASEAYRTKTRGRPHSPYADTLLPRYRIGALTAK